MTDAWHSVLALVNTVLDMLLGPCTEGCRLAAGANTKAGSQGSQVKCDGYQAQRFKVNSTSGPTPVV